MKNTIPTYAERINMIAAALAEAAVPYEIHEIYEGWQLRFGWCYGDVAVHDYTYGAKSGYVETYKFPWDDGDVSMLTPEEAAERIIALCDEWTNS